MTNITLKKKILLAASLSLIAVSFPVFAQPSSAASIDAAVVKAATNEWNFFGNRTTKTNTRTKSNGVPIIVKEGRKEGDEGIWQRISFYWENSNTGSSGKSRKEVMKDENPWSAIFVSFVMNRAGAGNQFKYSFAHRDYIRDAIGNRNAGKRTAPFVGYRLDEYAPTTGDLVCAGRGEDEYKVTYDNVLTYKTTRIRSNVVKLGNWAAHCDIVVATRAREVDVIGGNIGDSVTKHTINLVKRTSVKRTRVNGIRVDRTFVKYVIPSLGGRFVVISNNASAN